MKRMTCKQVLRILLTVMCIAVCAFAFGACTKDSGSAVESISIRARGLSGDTLTLDEGSEVTLAVTVKPEGTEAEVTFESSDTGVFTVSGAGVAKGAAEGKAELTVSAGGKSEKVNVVVRKYVPVTSIKFEKTEAEAKRGTQVNLEFTVLPANATDKTVNFAVTPKDEGVTVTSTGRLEISEETEVDKQFTVTATSVSNSTVSASVTVTVASYELKDIQILENDFHTEITSLTVPLDEPYRVLFLMPVPEKAIASGAKIPTVWTSDNEDVVKVNEKGRLTFHSEGTATITMEAMGFTKQIPVTVTEPGGNFKNGYYLPDNYVTAMSKPANTINMPTAAGWNVFADFREGGTGAPDAKKFVLQNYKYFTGPSSWFAGGGYCIEMGGWDNIHSGLEDDDMEGGGMPNLYMWSSVKLGANATSIRAHFEYRSSDATFQYKLRMTLIDAQDDFRVYHLCNWLTGSFNEDANLSAGESFVEADIPAELRGKTMLFLLEYDDIDYPTDGILNGVESVNIKYYSVMNYDGVPLENSLWVIGDNIMAVDYSGAMTQDIADQTGMTLFCDTVSGSTIISGNKLGLVDRIDSGYYESAFAKYGAPEVIAIQRGSNDVYSCILGDAELGTADSTDKSTVCGAIRYAISYFKEKYPAARIIWSTMIYRYNAEEEITNSFNSALKAICGELGAEVLDMYTESGINESNEIQFLSDGVHLSASGKEIYQAVWIAFIKNNSELSN